VAAALALTAGAAWAGEKTVTPFNGKCLQGWTCKSGKSVWTVGTAKLNPANPAELEVTPASGQGELVNAKAHGVDIYSNEKWGDCTISLEILVPKGSNSGVYVMGEYEIQVLDSFGKPQVGPGDMGGIYGASAPKVNASKAPGEWQTMVIEFVAPKFEGDKKVANGRIVKVTLNGQVIHENVELKSQTPGGVTGKEVPQGPLMFQGNHGAVAYRNIKITVPEK
jgi:hypothetical protein